MTTPTIVAVNTDEGFLDLLDERLGEHGYTHNRLVHVGEAYATIQESHPALVILDMPTEHPDASWTLLAKLRLDEDTAALPVIVCSADGPLLRGKAEHFRQQGYQTLETPFTVAAMLGCVEAALVSRSPTTQPNGWVSMKGGA